MRFDLFKNERERAEDLGYIKVLKTDTVAGRPGVMIWKPKATKPYANYYFRNEEERDEYVARELEGYKRREEDKKREKEEYAKAVAEMERPEVGELYYTSWGYDQTNYEYIVVLEVSASGKTVKAKRTGAKDMGHEGQCDLQKPINRPFGEEFTLQVRPGKYLVGSYPFCYDGTGSRRKGHFSQVTEGAVYHETDAYSGH